MYPTNRCLRTVSWKEESFACAHYARYASASDKHVAWIPESLILLWDKSSSVTSFCFAQIQSSKKRIYKLIEMVPAFDVFSSRLISWLSFSFSMTSVRSSSVALFSWPIQGDCTVGRMSIDLQDILHQSAAQFDLRSKFIIFGFMSDQQRARRARNWSALMWLLCNSSWWARISRLERLFSTGNSWEFHVVWFALYHWGLEESKPMCSPGAKDSCHLLQFLTMSLWMSWEGGQQKYWSVFHGVVRWIHTETHENHG